MGNIGGGETPEIVTSHLDDWDTSVLSAIHLAAKDSPNFRAHVEALDEETEEVSKWMESIVKALKIYGDKLDRMSRLSSLLF